MGSNELESLCWERDHPVVGDQIPGLQRPMHLGEVIQFRVFRKVKPKWLLVSLLLAIILLGLWVTHASTVTLVPYE